MQHKRVTAYLLISFLVYTVAYPTVFDENTQSHGLTLSGHDDFDLPTGRGETLPPPITVVPGPTMPSQDASSTVTETSPPTSTPARPTSPGPTAEGTTMIYLIISDVITFLLTTTILIAIKYTWNHKIYLISYFHRIYHRYHNISEEELAMQRLNTVVSSMSPNERRLARQRNQISAHTQQQQIGFTTIDEFIDADEYIWDDFVSASSTTGLNRTTSSTFAFSNLGFEMNELPSSKREEGMERVIAHDSLSTEVDITTV